MIKRLTVFLDATLTGNSTAGDPGTYFSFKDSESRKLNQHSEWREVY